MFPIYKENSRLPAILSKISPIEIGAITLGIIIFSRGDLTRRVKQHETIHYYQWRELLFIGFLILYPVFWLVGMLKYRDGGKAYRAIPFEVEAYTYDSKPRYISERKRFAWLKYVRAI